MARYIKANPKVAQYLNLENDRNTVADGNYLLWQADMLEFGPLTELNNTLAMIGGLALMPHEAREEQDGTVIRPLPEPTDERFRYQPLPPVEESGEDVEEQPEGNGESEAPTDQPEAETPTEGNGGSQEITAGDVGSVEDLINFAPAEETE